jgi:quercetin dioxygenase-like cupin family protein
MELGAFSISVAVKDLRASRQFDEKLGSTPFAGDRLEVENVVTPGAGPPMHVHRHQEEALTVREGRLGYQRPGGPEQFAGPGETVAFKPGEAHRFWNAGEGDLRCTAYIEPADNAEYFLTELFESTKRSGGRGRTRSTRRS